MDVVERMRADLRECADPEKQKAVTRFFKTEAGTYGEGDRFIGVMVPTIRAIAKRYYREPEIQDLYRLLGDPVHECRLLALLTLVQKFPKADEAERQKIYDFYLSHTRFINNWDLVDLSAYQIVGRYLECCDRTPLYRLAQSSWLWDQRISIVATWEYIRKGDFNETLALADLLLQHPHDLIQKAVGWMLREVGKRDKRRLIAFLDERSPRMPRVMLRYAIEKFDPHERRRYLLSK